MASRAAVDVSSSLATLFQLPGFGVKNNRGQTLRSSIVAFTNPRKAVAIELSGRKRLLQSKDQLRRTRQESAELQHFLSDYAGGVTDTRTVASPLSNDFSMDSTST